MERKRKEKRTSVVFFKKKDPSGREPQRKLRFLSSGVMRPIRSDKEALTLGLYLSLTAPTEEKYEHARR